MLVAAAARGGGATLLQPTPGKCLWPRRGRGPQGSLARERRAELFPSEAWGVAAPPPAGRPRAPTPGREAWRKKGVGFLWTGLGLEAPNSGGFASGV